VEPTGQPKLSPAGGDPDKANIANLQIIKKARTE
jgi:hypothetical protein